MSDLAAFLGRKPDLTTPAMDTGVDKRTEYSVAAESEPSTPGQSVITDVTPSGIEVMYQAAPRRLYRVNGVECPSVTTVLDILSKGGLTWWGMKVGVQGVLALIDKGVLSSAVDWTTDKERLSIGAAIADDAAIVAALTEHKLTVNHQKDRAADRGTNVHDALEVWGNTGEIPNPMDFPETERGYVHGLVGFLTDVQPEPVRQEVMVGSVANEYAGRFDLVFKATEREYTSKCYPKKADKRETLSAGTLLGDLKTSSGVYESHFLQLAAYEGAAVECGYPATDGQYVIHVTAAGKYELVRSHASLDQFLAIRRAYSVLADLKKSA